MKVRPRDLEDTFGRWLEGDEDLVGLANQMSKAYNIRTADPVLQYADDVLAGYGVEDLRWDEDQMQFTTGSYADLAALYVNMGDDYTPTVIWDADEGRWHLTDIMSWRSDYESRKQREKEEREMEEARPGIKWFQDQGEEGLFDGLGPKRQSSLRSKVIRLAHANKALRPLLLPILATEEEDDDEKEGRYDEGPMTEAEKAKLFRENPEFAEEHYKNRGRFKDKDAMLGVHGKPGVGILGPEVDRAKDSDFRNSQVKTTNNGKSLIVVNKSGIYFMHIDEIERATRRGRKGGVYLWSSPGNGAYLGWITGKLAKRLLAQATQSE